MARADVGTTARARSGERDDDDDDDDDAVVVERATGGERSGASQDDEEGGFGGREYDWSEPCGVDADVVAPAGGVAATKL
mmetsp:Transcript_8155/g.30275  ORF Transcript_8155/g.30275 Transcript_8155/m.30275 type:complete len:80 (-) Transcript_8155:1530-1769(-)